MTSFPEAIALQYTEAKTELLMWTGASEDLLHVHAGLLIFVLSAVLLRRKIGSPVPLALVAFFAVANEVLDWTTYPPRSAWEPLLDLVNTIFWPSMLFLCMRCGARFGRSQQAERLDHETQASSSR